MKIRICDDDHDSAEEWVEQIGNAVGEEHSVERLKDPLDAIQELVDRKKVALDKGAFPADGSARLDDIDILVVDYDLIHIDEKGSRTTGEGVARLAKTYSACKFVVVLNQYSKVDFDLTLTGHIKSFADINVDSRVIGEPALWKRDAKGDFRPSYWAPIIDLVDERAAFVAKLPNTLDWKIVEALGLTPGELTGISDTAFTYISQDAKTLDELASVTAVDLINHLLGGEEGPALLASSRDIASTFVASRIGKWLDRAMLRPLDALIDAAHLAERWPYLLDAKSEDLASFGYWETLGGRESDALKARTPAAALLEAGCALIGKKVFVLARMEAEEGVRKLGDEYDFSTAADVVFAEDTSRFVPREKAREFRAGFNNFNDRRFVEMVEGKTYGPQRRFAFGD